MQRIQSPTLLSYILIGFVIVSLPLIATIVTAIARVDRLSHESRNTIMAVQQNAVASRGLVQRATSMERSARQYQALNDRSFRKLYIEHRNGARTLLDQISSKASNQQVQTAVADVSRAERRVTALVDAPLDSFSVEDLDTELEALKRAATSVVREQNVVSRSMADVMSDKTQSLKKSLVAQAFLVIPVSACLLVALFFVIGPPLRQIRHSISALARGSLGETIQIKGVRDLEELGQHLDRLRTRLVQLEEQKSQFLRNVSHELKTPLTNIREGAELLLEDSTHGTDSDSAFIARIVQSNSVRLQRMIETLLRYGAEGDLNAGQPNELVRLDQIVLQLIERYSEDGSAHSVPIEHQLETLEVSGNPKRLQVIVENLLSNAVKFTPDGGRIAVRLQQRGENIELEVWDTGPGVAMEDRERVFEWFYTGKRPQDSVVAGSGMGLSIAREYAEQHDGRIELLPTAEGARFLLTLRKIIQ